MRILLFLATNFAIMIVASITLRIIGVESIMAENGVDLNLTSLLIFCGVFGMSGSIISLFLSKWMAKRSMGVRIIDQPRSAQEQWLVRTVEDLARKAGIGMPEVGIFPSPASNAFATGWNKNNSLVAVSQGLLDRFEEDEARAVMAHEIGHVANGDMITLTLIQGVVNTFVMFFARIIGHTVDRVVFKNERGHGFAFYAVTFVAEMVLGFLASMIVMWFSRWREYRADAAAAELYSTQSMVRALQRLQREHEIPSQMPSEMAAFGINGNTKATLAKFFMSHPPLEQRIAALRHGR